MKTCSTWSRKRARYTVLRVCNAYKSSYCNFYCFAVYQKSSFLSPFMCAKIISFLLMCVHKRLLRGQYVKMRFFSFFSKGFWLVVGRVRKSWKIEKVMMIIRSKVWSLSMHSRYMNIFSCCERGVLDRETLFRFV